MWIHIDGILRRLTLQTLLGKNATVLLQEKEKIVYLTKLRDAWIAGILLRF